MPRRTARSTASTLVRRHDPARLGDRALRGCARSAFRVAAGNIADQTQGAAQPISFDPTLPGPPPS